MAGEVTDQFEVEYLTDHYPGVVALRFADGTEREVVPLPEGSSVAGGPLPPLSEG